MPKGMDYAYGAGPGGGLGTKHGGIASPQGPCGYDITPNGGGSQKGGEPMGPFGSHKESPNEMMGVARDSMTGNPSSQGGFVTPMDTSNSAMPGITGQSSGTGPNNGGISSPWSGPFGDKVG